METVQQLLELFPYAIAGSIVAGIICAFLGVFVISQRVVFLGAVLTQASIAGVAFSFLHLINVENIISSALGIHISEESFFHNFEPAFFSLFFAIITVLIFSQSYKQKFLTQDAILGIIFVVAISVRIMFIQKSPVAEVSEIESILKGDILFIGASEFYTLVVILLLSLTTFILFQKQLKFVTFDAETAEAHGINSRFWLLVFYILVGTGISLTTRFVGDVFVFAYLIIPSSIGLLISRKVSGVFLTATLVGALVPPAAIYISFNLDLSSGPTAVVLSFILWMAIFLGKKMSLRLIM